ncbi:MAG: hypothetical protein MHMPM18_004487 [Marteilia pararefringens]
MKDIIKYEALSSRSFVIDCSMQENIIKKIYKSIIDSKIPINANIVGNKINITVPEISHERRLKLSSLCDFFYSQYVIDCRKIRNKYVSILDEFKLTHPKNELEKLNKLFHTTFQNSTSKYLPEVNKIKDIITK